MIEVPPKFLIPKQENKYRLPGCNDSIYDGIFDYKVYSKALFKPKLYWEERNINDLIVLDHKLYSGYLMKYLIVVYTVDQTNTTVY